MIQELRIKEFNNRLERLSFARKQTLRAKGTPSEKIHVVYVMTHVGICGGVKVIFEHANRLQKLGAKVTIVSHYPMPTWFPIEVPYNQVPFDLELAKGIPVCDVIVATYWDHIQSCIDTGIAPVVYFEQGDFHLFDYSSMNQTLKKFIHQQLDIPQYIYTVSKPASLLINEIYGREATVYPNAVDEKVFSIDGEKETGNHPYILMVGGEAATFKGLNVIIQAYEKVKDEHQIDLYWITPDTPSDEGKAKVTKYFVNPPQKLIGGLYRGATMYVCGSIYESFCLPPLEAMACGCPVVTTGNKGSLEYAVHNENALICNLNDPEDMAKQIREIFSNPSLKEHLIKNGLVTASNYKWEIIMLDILDYYKKIASYEVQQIHDIDEWDLFISDEQFLNKDDYNKLLKFMKNTPADLIQVPIVYDIEGDLKLAKWEIIANRKQSENDYVEKCYCPITPVNKLRLYDIPAYRSFFKKEYEKALEEFLNLYEQEDKLNTKAVYSKWIIITLLRLQRKSEARKKIKAFLQEYPHYTDLHYMNYLLDEKDKVNNYSINTIHILGEATSYSEYLFNVTKLIT
ncbi:glycosyltransferase family 4 protein [Fictibacillus sp. S7]|uniref:glycosyltransferase family 4 protein n=1 Tax=Fictibacillus sp. S7 TaxID=2212476 RepID=UPI0010117FD7|nr:glycosyltransferase family 4 protein [Fictibacillus sp. S7]RXZ02212.1 glycosyl transferase family 1 [Fictibacillus sp. S7]